MHFVQFWTWKLFSLGLFLEFLNFVQSAESRVFLEMFILFIRWAPNCVVALELM